MQKKFIKHGIEEADRRVTQKMKDIENTLEVKGYHICTMIYCKSEYELYNQDNEVVMDHLSVSQLSQLTNIL